VRRPKRLRIERIKNRKHPCYGERGLYAAEAVDKGTIILNYTGRIAVTTADDHDTNKSSYLLTLFHDEESGDDAPPLHFHILLPVG